MFKRVKTYVKLSNHPHPHLRCPFLPHLNSNTTGVFIMNNVTLATQVCLRCKPQKRKCDKLLPACSLCKRYEVPLRIYQYPKLRLAKRESVQDWVGNVFTMLLLYSPPWLRFIRNLQAKLLPGHPNPVRLFPRSHSFQSLI